MSAKFSALPALFAAAAMVAAPVEAAAVAPVRSAAAVSPSGEALSYHRYYRYRRGPSAGDVLATVLVVGGIAAAVKAASRDRDRDRSYPPPPYRDGPRYDDMRGIDRAVDQCVAAVERDARVDSVDRVEREGEGWRISGALFDGKPFTCTLGRDGRIERIAYDGYAPRMDDRSRDDRDDRESDAREDRGYEGADGGDRSYDDDRQYDDDRYARAWGNRQGNDEAQAEAGPDDAADVDDARDAGDGTDGNLAQPDYPGGPVPGDEPAGNPAV